jgi:hypothetical protein
MKIFSQGVEAASSSEQLSQARHDLVKLNKQLELVSEEAQRLQEENVNLLESITTLTKQNRTLQADLSKTKRQSILMVDGSQVETAKGLQQQHAKEMEVLQKQITALTSLLDDLGEDATKAAAMRGQLAGLTTAMQDMREQNEELERVLLVREKELSKLTTLYNKSDSLAEQNAILQDELDVMQEKLRGMTDGKRDVLSTQPGVSIADELDQVARHKVGAELAAGKVFAKQAAEAFELSKVMQLCQNLSHVYASLQGQFLEGMTAELDQLRTKGLTETAQAHRAQGLVSHWLKKPVNIDHSKIEQRIVELEKKDSEFRGCMVQLTEAIHGCLSMFNKFMSRLTMPSESAVRASHIQNRDEVVEKLQNLLNLQMQNIVKILQTVMPESKQRRLALRRDLLSKMLGQVFGKARTCNAPEVEEKETLEGGLAKFVLRTLSLTEEQDSMMQPSAQAVYNLCNKLLVHITDIKNTRFNSTTVGLLCADFSENLQQVIATALYASGSKYDDWREERLVLCDDSIRKIESLLEEKSKNRKEPFKGRAVTNTSNAAAQAYAAVSREGREVNSRETDTIAIPSQVAGIFNVVLMWVMHILTLEQKPLAPQAYQEINTLVGRFVDAYNCQLAVIHHAHYVDIEPGNMKSMTDEQAQAYLVKLSEVKELRDAGRAKAHEEYHQLFTDVLSQLKPLINVILQGGDAANIIIQLKEILESGLEKMQSAVLQAQELRAGEIERVQAMLYERNESSAATTQSLFGGHLVRSQGSEASKEVARHTVTASGSAT